jgi:hypothetical protein
MKLYSLTILVILVLSGCAKTSQQKKNSRSFSDVFLEVITEVAVESAVGNATGKKHDFSLDDAIGNNETSCKKLEAKCPVHYISWRQDEGSIGCSCKERTQN